MPVWPGWGLAPLGPLGLRATVILCYIQALALNPIEACATREQREPLHPKPKGVRVLLMPLGHGAEAGLCMEVTASSCTTCLGIDLRHQTTQHRGARPPATWQWPPSPPRSPSRFLSGTLTVTQALRPMSYLPGLLRRGQVLNKIKIPLTSYRLDLIKHPLIKGKQMSASIS